MLQIIICLIFKPPSEKSRWRGFEEKVCFVFLCEWWTNNVADDPLYSTILSSPLLQKSNSNPEQTQPKVRPSWRHTGVYLRLFATYCTLPWWNLNLKNCSDCHNYLTMAPSTSSQLSGPTFTFCLQFFRSWMHILYLMYYSTSHFPKICCLLCHY